MDGWDFGSIFDGSDTNFGGGLDYTGGTSADDLGFVPDYTNMDNVDSTSFGTGDTGSGTGSWTNSMGNWLGSSSGQTAMGLGSAALAGYAKGKETEAELKLKEQLAEKQYAAQMAEQEKYYQSHGKQLQDAFGGFAKYAGTAGNPQGQLLQYGNFAKQNGLLGYGG